MCKGFRWLYSSWQKLKVEVSKLVVFTYVRANCDMLFKLANLS